MSSCVFLLAAANSRGILGKVGLHRPFSPEISAKELSYSQYLSRYEKLESDLKSYLKKFGVSTKIVDEMLVVPSDEIKILNKRELDNLGLGINNIAAQERRKSIFIEVCGNDLYRRKISIDEKIDHCVDRHDSDDPGKTFSECSSNAKSSFPQHFKRLEECGEKIYSEGISFW